MFINNLFTDKLSNKLNYSPVNSPTDHSHLLCYSPETQHIFTSLFILLIHLRKHGDVLLHNKCEKVCLQ